MNRSPILFHKPNTLSTVSPSDHCHGFTAAFSDFAATSHSGLASWHWCWYPSPSTPASIIWPELSYFIQGGSRVPSAAHIRCWCIRHQPNGSLKKKKWCQYLSDISNTVSDMHRVHVWVIKGLSSLPAIVACSTTSLDNTFHYITTPYHNP